METATRGRLEPAGTACNASGLPLVNFRVFEPESLRVADVTSFVFCSQWGWWAAAQTRGRFASLLAINFGWEPVPVTLRPQPCDSPVCTVTTGRVIRVDT